MSSGLYVATSEPNSGKSIIVLGLMRTLLGKTATVGYFRPIIDDFEKGKKDNHINTVTSHFDLEIAYEDCYGFTRSQVVEKYNTGKGGEVFDRIIEKYNQLTDSYDFVVVEGTDFSEAGSVMEFDINVLVAKNLGIPAIIVTNGTSKKTAEILGKLKLAYDTFIAKEVQIMAVVANKVAPNETEAIEDSLRMVMPASLEKIVIPSVKSLKNPTLKEITEFLGGKVLFGENFLNNQAGSFGVGAMQLHNYLTKFKKDSLVITPGDRADIILGALQASTSVNYPKISGIILTGGITPEESILKLIEGIKINLPIISVKAGTFDITNKIGNIKSAIYAENTQKITTSIAIFEKYVDTDLLAEKLIKFESTIVTPRMFQYNLLKRAQKQKKRIVLPEGYDERILRAASRLLASGVVDVVLLGNATKIKSKTDKLGIPLDLDRITIIDPVASEYNEDFATTFYELRKHKGVNLDMANDLMVDVSYFGTMMIYKAYSL